MVVQEQALSSIEHVDNPSYLKGRPLQTHVKDTVSSTMDSKTDFVEFPSATDVPAVAAEETGTISHALLLPSPKANTMIRYIMTAVAFLLMVAAFLSISIASQYHFLLACVWMILFVFFIGFCYFIQETVMNDSARRRRQIFHPAVHALGDWIASGIKNFVDDCQSEYAVLLLSNEAAHDNYRNFDSTATRVESSGPNGTRPRTKLFRAVVRPVMNVVFWRRRKQRQNTAAYTPPNTSAV